MGIHKSFCVEVWPSLTARQVYSLVVFAIQFCLPLLATAGLYLRIYSRLRTRQAARRRLDIRRTTLTSTTGARSPKTETIAMRGGTGSGGTGYGGTGSGKIGSCGTGSAGTGSGGTGPSGNGTGGTGFGETALGGTRTGETRLVGSGSDGIGSGGTGPGGTGTGQRSPVAGGRKGRTSRLLALIIAQFVAFWLPWNVLSLVVEFDRMAVPVDLFRLLDLGLKVLAMAGSACVNPILYCWSNDNIRGELIASIRQIHERQVS